MKELIEKFYTGAHATSYNASRQSGKWYFENTVLEKYVSTLKKGYRVVDAPVGTGRYFPLYKKYNINVTGFDFSTDMLTEAKKEKERINLTMELHQINLIKQPLPHNYDILICSRFLNLFPWSEAEKSLMTMLSSIEVGGVITIRVSEETNVPVISNKIHTHNKQKVCNVFDTVGFKITHAHIFPNKGKPGQYILFEVKKS